MTEEEKSGVYSDTVSYLKFVDNMDSRRHSLRFLCLIFSNSADRSAFMNIWIKKVIAFKIFAYVKLPAIAKTRRSFLLPLPNQFFPGGVYWSELYHSVQAIVLQIHFEDFCPKSNNRMSSLYPFWENSSVVLCVISTEGYGNAVVLSMLRRIV